MKAPPVTGTTGSRMSMNEVAYRRLRHALLSGRIEPGTVLSLRQLADEFGTSMMPVRDAVTRLAAEHAVEVLPKRGIVVPHLEEEDAEDLWSLRLQLEGSACARAARSAGPADVARMATLRDAVEAAARRNDLHGVLECNSDFQFAVYQAAGSPMLLQLIEILRMKSVPHCTAAIRVMLEERPPYFTRTFRHHDDLVDAIDRGDARGAREAKLTDLKELRDLVNLVRRRSE